VVVVAIDERDQMYKAIGYWTWPEDLDAFEQHYKTVHVPLAAALPGVKHLSTFKADESSRDGGVYRVAEVGWADESSFKEAMESEAWSAMAADAAGMMERFGAQLHSAMGWDDTPRT
jgi:uncharacterized protein (TIGR02118 family)